VSTLRPGTGENAIPAPPLPDVEPEAPLVILRCTAAEFDDGGASPAAAAFVFVFVGALRFHHNSFVAVSR
jgi:hypothetical protein